MASRPSGTAAVGSTAPLCMPHALAMATATKAVSNVVENPERGHNIPIVSGTCISAIRLCAKAL